MRKVNDVLEENNKENHEIKAKCKFLIGQYKKELESELADSVSSYKDGDDIDVGNCFEIL